MFKQSAFPLVSRFPIAMLVVLWAAMGDYVFAQVILEQAPRTLTLEGYANVGAAGSFAEDGAHSGSHSNARIDAGIRALALYRFEENAVGVRGELVASPEEDIEAGERSALAFGPWGRLEFGKRRGLPTTLYGYAPNSFAFTSSDFSVATGRSLDPGGTLATSFLSLSLEARINAVSSLGAIATLLDDASTKIAYISPKARGWQGGLAYASNVDGAPARFRDLLQGGLVYERYTERNAYRAGGSFSVAQGDALAPGQGKFENLRSISLGVGATLVDEWTLGIGITYDGDSGVLLVPDTVARASAWGLTASVNYNAGAWTVGGYLQQAQAESDTARPGADRLRVLQTGLSYRFNTKVRLFSALYLYHFDDEGGAVSEDRYRGAVLLGGVRLTL